MTLTCRDCNRPFELADGEVRFFTAKFNRLPARCSFCRAEKAAWGRHLRQMGQDIAAGETAPDQTAGRPGRRR